MLDSSGTINCSDPLVFFMMSQNINARLTSNKNHLLSRVWELVNYNVNQLHTQDSSQAPHSLVFSTGKPHFRLLNETVSSQRRLYTVHKIRLV